MGEGGNVTVHRRPHALQQPGGCPGDEIEVLCGKEHGVAADDELDARGDRTRIGVDHGKDHGRHVKLYAFDQERCRGVVWTVGSATGKLGEREDVDPVAPQGACGLSREDLRLEGAGLVVAAGEVTPSVQLSLPGS